MIHHQGDIILSQIIEAGSFREYVPDEFMIALAAALLVCLLRITVKHVALEFTGFLIDLYRGWISELGTAITIIPNSG